MDDAVANARRLETLAKDCLHEGFTSNEDRAEQKLIEFVHELERHPAMLKSVRSQLDSDNQQSTDMPGVHLRIDANDKVTGLSFWKRDRDRTANFNDESLDVIHGRGNKASVDRSGGRTNRSTYIVDTNTHSLRKRGDILGEWVVGDRK